MPSSSTQPDSTRSHSERGAAAIELALVMCLFCPIVLFGTADLASISYDSIEVASAAHAGALYGAQSTTFASNTSAIQSAAQAEAADFGTNLTVTPTIFYACSSAINGTQYTSQATATSNCTGSGNHVLEFVQVNTSVTVNAPFHLPAIATSYTLHGQAILEVEE
ncbi:TadE-like protein [Bryocella elongata]|uniref:TadE-like protein n=1 Tax=Bryocella elongata TaxID=863522 RepID=A0A1H5Y1F8_9BACT|nr:TadE/TadG family type IV pilus assembly protein [Bryocella elongata]SEG17605.1 TadE-like protein [Bryocella elongata]